MTQTAIRLKTRVLAGSRIEVTAPGLVEGDEVDVTFAPSVRSNPQSYRVFNDVIAFLDSLPPVQRTPEEREQIERGFHEERDSWDR